MENPDRIIDDKALSKDALVAVCNSVGDDNLIHRDRAVAQKAGFRVEPIAGTYLAARALYHAYNLDEFSAPINSLEIEFLRRVYVDEPIQWSLKGQGSRYLIEAINCTNKKTICKAVADCAPAQPSAFQGKAIRPYYIALPQESNAVFQQVTGLRFPWAVGIHIAQLAPSMLLELLDDVNKSNGAKYRGVNASMKQQFTYEKQRLPSFIEGEILSAPDIELKGRLNLPSSWNFPFAVSLQTRLRNQIGRTEINCNTDGRLDLSPFYDHATA